MKCPNCGVEAPAGAADCAACGVIFAKFKKKLENLELPPPAKINLWKGRVVALVLVTIWIVAFGLYYRRVVATMPRKPAGPARGR